MLRSRRRRRVRSVVATAARAVIDDVAVASHVLDPMPHRTRGLAKGTQSAILLGDVDVLKEKLQEAVDFETDVTVAAIYDVQGNILAMTERNWKYRIRKMTNSASGKTTMSVFCERIWFS